MTDEQASITGATPPTKEERYVGFLMAQWPKLARTALAAPDELPRTRTTVLDRALDAVGEAPGLRLEFGVWRGNSIRRCAERYPRQRWVGFDSFEGFPDDGRLDWQKPFKVIELPDTPPNVTLVKGYFSEMLAPFLADTPGEVAFVNIDCDLYSSTADVFAALEAAGRLRPGLTIYFDELINYADYMWNESLALFEMLQRTGLGVEWLACDQHLRQPEESAAHFVAGDHPTWTEDMRAGYWMQAACRLTEGPVDCGPMDDPGWRHRLRSVIEAMAVQAGRREAAKADIDRRRTEQEAERQRRYEARKALEKRRQRETLARRRGDRAPPS